MEKFIIQIYEIQTPDEAEKLIEMGVDHIGSVLLSEEDWKVSSIKDTIQLVAQSGSKSSLIPLFNTPDAIFRVLEYYQPDIVHFCENLASPNQIAQDLINLQKSVKQRFPQIHIMRSVPIAQKDMADKIPSLEIAKMFEPYSDLFLTDTLILTSSQPVEGFVGITGKTCDWDTAARLVTQSRIPMILAGGLSPDNVCEGILHTRPAGADTCTGTNARDDMGNPIRFKKDLEKVRRFVEECRKTNLETEISRG
jgi:phosphoribosylanthranilate isomerase